MPLKLLCLVGMGHLSVVAADEAIDNVHREWCKSGRREAAIVDLRVGFGCEAKPDEEDDDDRRQNGADRIDREGGGDGDLVRGTPAFAAERIMELEIEARTGAGHGSQSPDRTNHRNGYRERPWEMRAGRIDLEIPQLRGPACRASWSRAAPPRRP